MLTSLRCLVFAGCIGLIVATSASSQGTLNAFPVNDLGKFFSKEAVERANSRIAAIKREYKTDLLVETFAHPPDDKKAAYEKAANDKNGKARFFSEWARQRYETQGVRGISVLICKEPQYLFVEMGKRTAEKAFTRENQNALRKVLMEHFGNREFDEGLLDGVGYVATTLEKTIGKNPTAGSPVGGSKERTGTRTNDEKHRGENVMGGGGILGWVCIGVGVLLALWVVIGLFRAMTGGGRPIDRAPGAYAGGNYGPQQGYAPPAPAGGGGFMSGLLGGMLGGAAGSWAYDRFFRGESMGGASYPPSAYGGGGGAGPTGPSDADVSSSGGGGAWGDAGDNSGGGTADTGGGDWGGGGGGGGDDGGGGDWGGGGGDGGGGDWGGGGDSSGGGDW